MKGRIPWDIERPGSHTIREWEIDPRRSALLILDMQLGYVYPDHGLGKMLRKSYPEISSYYYTQLEQVIPSIRKLRDFFRRNKLEVFYTRMGFQLPQAKDLPAWHWRRSLLEHQKDDEKSLFFRESKEYEIVTELRPLDSELVLDKNTLNPFNSTPLDQISRNMGLENLLITGVLTNAAVESTARSAGDRGYNVIVVSDGCAAYTGADQENPLSSVNFYVVKNVQEIIDQLSPLLKNG